VQAFAESMKFFMKQVCYEGGNKINPMKRETKQGDKPSLIAKKRKLQLLCVTTTFGENK
jgi:hypothetical protein